jgi:hypothetical protein
MEWGCCGDGTGYPACLLPWLVTLAGWLIMRAMPSPLPELTGAMEHRAGYNRLRFPACRLPGCLAAGGDASRGPGNGASVA